MNRIKFARFIPSLTLILLSSLALATHAGTPVSGDLTASQILKPGQKITLGLWNIHKEQGQAFLKEFAALANASDFLCLQEVLLTADTKSQWNSDYGLEWNFASAWEDGGSGTGTAVMSRYHAQTSEAIITEDGQPIVNTPKSSLISYYPIEGSTQSLMVISTHSINFTTMAPYRRQLTELAGWMAEHRGPVIWAGDFNTWNGSRWDYLMSTAGDLGLTHVEIATDPRGQILDHIFYRGIAVEKVTVLQEFNESDHKPLFLEGVLAPTAPASIVVFPN